MIGGFSTLVIEAVKLAKDCSHLGAAFATFMDSGGIQALVRIREVANDAGLPLQLLGPARMDRRMLDVSGLAGVFDIVD